MKDGRSTPTSPGGSAAQDKIAAVLARSADADPWVGRERDGLWKIEFEVGDDFLSLKNVRCLPDLRIKPQQRGMKDDLSEKKREDESIEKEKTRWLDKACLTSTPILRRISHLIGPF